VSDRRSTLVERILDGRLRADQVTDADLDQLAPAARDLVREAPDALRYLLHARRFGTELPLDALRGQDRIRTWSTLLASHVVDPFDLAELEAWAPGIDAAARVATNSSAAAHA